jgi:hypothetical protein
MNTEMANKIIQLDERVKVATMQYYNSAAAATVHDPVLGACPSNSCMASR